MKKISIMFATMALALGFSACNETWDDNPTLITHEGDPVIEFLNVPEMANMALTITEENKSQNFHLTCSQPKEYGYAASVAYVVEVSLSEDFTTPVVEGAPASVILTTTFTKCDQINPTYRSIAEAMSKMLDIKSDKQLPTDPHKLYVRLRSVVVNESGKAIPNTSFTSNTVSFAGVSVSYLAIVVPDQPTGYYVRGGMNNWLNDGLLSSYEFVTTTEANVYELDYIEIAKGVEFKIADANWGDLNLGLGDPIVFGEKISMGWNAGNITLDVDFKGSITLSGSGQNWTTIFEALEPDTPGQPSGIYMRGGMNDWGTKDQFLTTDVKNVWSIPSITIPAGTEFKVADANWSDINLGGAGVDGGKPTIAAGGKMTLEPGGGNIECTDGFTGSATLRLKGGKYVLTLVAQ